MNIVYFHAGADTLENSFIERGHIFHSITLTKSFQDIPFYNHETGFNAEEMLRILGPIDVIFASPDCRSYSTAAANKYRRNKMNGHLTSVPHGINCDKFNGHLWMMIDEIRPILYFVENPRGSMQFMYFIEGRQCFVTSYCQYGAKVKKPTNIFTNHPCPNFRPVCKKKDNHVHVLIKDIKDAYERSKFPKELCEHLVNLCEQFSYEGEMIYENIV